MRNDIVTLRRIPGLASVTPSPGLYSPGSFYDMPLFNQSRKRKKRSSIGSSRKEKKVAKRKRRKAKKRKAKKRTYRKRASVGRPRRRTKKRATRRKRSVSRIGYRPSLLKRRGVRGLYPSYMGRAKAGSAVASIQRIVAPTTLKGVGAATVGLAAGRGIGALLVKYVPQVSGQMPTVLGVLAGAAIGEIVGAKVFKSPAAGDMAAVGNLLIGIDLIVGPQINKAFGMAGLYEVNGLGQVRLPEDTNIMGLSQVRLPEGMDVSGLGYSDVPDVVTEEELIEDPKSLF